MYLVTNLILRVELLHYFVRYVFLDDGGYWIVVSEGERKAALAQLVENEDLLALLDVQDENLLGHVDFGQQRLDVKQAGHHFERNYEPYFHVLFHQGRPLFLMTFKIIDILLLIHLQTIDSDISKQIKNLTPIRPCLDSLQYHILLLFIVTAFDLTNYLI